MNAFNTYTHQVTYKGQTRLLNAETYQSTIEGLIEKYGPGDVPHVTELKPSPDTIPADPPTEVVDLPAPVVRTPAGEVDLAGKLRSEALQYQAEDNGFSLKPVLYSVGTRVIDLGVSNAKRSQQEHEKKPFARDVAASLVAQVRAEQRIDLAPIPLRSFYLKEDGLLGANERAANAFPEGRVLLTEHGFDSLFSRFPCSSGGSYLRSCPPALRAYNFNHWSKEVGEREDRAQEEAAPRIVPAQHVVLRTRNARGGGREVYAGVTESYTAFDADRIGEALRFAFPEDARGSLDYDGQRFRIEGLWHTNIAPEEFVAGEFFKAGVIITSDDGGAGSIRVRSVIWRNLCLNLIILDKAVGVDIRIRHMGSVEKLAQAFRQAFRKGLSSIEPFRKAWGSAMAERDEKLVERVAGTTSESIEGKPVSEVLPGIFHGILKRDLVEVKGRKPDVVKKLLQLHAEDEAAQQYGYSRASVVNAFTRYAHVVEEDPFAADLIREGAGRLLSASAGRQPAPLPYVPVV